MPYAAFDNADRGIASLGKALFPDPTAIASAGYYGAKQREAMLAGNESMGKQALQNQMFRRLPGGQQIPYMPAPSGSPIGSPPIPASDPNTPMVGGGTYGATPGAYGAPPPAPAPSLSSVVTQPPAPAAVSDYMNTHPNPVTSTTPPAQSSPAPNSGAPPAPNTTGSDGSVPGNDAGGATIHPGTFQAPGGGTKTAPPAQANGSPAPVAFNPTLVSALAGASGMPPAALNSTLASYVAQARKDGVIDDKTANYFESGFGNATPMTEAGATTRTGMTNATTLEDRRLQEAGATLRSNLTIAGNAAAAAALPFKYQPGGPGTPVLTTTTGEAVAKHLQPFDQASDTQARTLISIAGPNEAETLVPQSTVGPEGVRKYSPTRETAALTPVLVIDPANNNSLKTISTAEFNKGNYVRAPANIPPDQAAVAQDNLDQVMARRFPPPPVPFQNQAFLSPARANGTDNSRLVALQTQLYQTSPDGNVRGNWRGAADAAITQAQQEGWLPTEEEAAKDREGFVGTKVIDRSHIFQTQDAQGKGTNTYYLLPKKSLSTTVAPGTTTPPPATTAPPPATTAPPATTSDNPGFLSTLFSNPFNFKGGNGATAAPPSTPAPTSTAMPAGAVAAMPGYPDGQVVTGSNGTKVVVRGGYGYPAPQPDMGR